VSNNAHVLKAAAAIANARGNRRGVPTIVNILDLLPAHLRAEVIEDAEAVLDALGTAAQQSHADLYEALEESVKLQSHYAMLLNMHDGGERIGFANAEAWLTRLATLARTAPSKQVATQSRKKGKAV
jgi:hypothetical protein